MGARNTNRSDVADIKPIFLHEMDWKQRNNTIWHIIMRICLREFIQPKQLRDLLIKRIEQDKSTNNIICNLQHSLSTISMDDKRQIRYIWNFN